MTYRLRTSSCRACGAAIHVSGRGTWAVKVDNQKQAIPFRNGWVCDLKCHDEAKRQLAEIKRRYFHAPAPRKSEDAP